MHNFYGNCRYTHLGKTRGHSTFCIWGSTSDGTYVTKRTSSLLHSSLYWRQICMFQSSHSYACTNNERINNRTHESDDTQNLVTEIYCSFTWTKNTHGNVSVYWNVVQIISKRVIRHSVKPTVVRHLMLIHLIRIFFLLISYLKIWILRYTSPWLYQLFWLAPRLFKNLVRTSKRTSHFTIINWITLFKAIIPVYNEKHKNSIE
jgi:hypothetical protein